MGKEEEGVLKWQMPFRYLVVRLPIFSSKYAKQIVHFRIKNILIKLSKYPNNDL